MNMMTAPIPIWTAAEAAAATNGRAVGAWRATGVSIDSRSVQPGDLFVALRGPNFDGHDFVAAALQAGAAAAMVHRQPSDVSPSAPLVHVQDTFQGLQDLGKAGRWRCRGRLIGVTGSVGKTGTKEALRQCLQVSGATYATVGSLNNHWGVPLSLARLPADAAFGVFELGMNHAGEIGVLSRQVCPEVAIITAVEAVHLEFFPSVAAIADAKAEIFEGMPPRGTAILPRDNPHYGRLLAAARTKGLARIWSFGANAAADARLVELRADAEGSEVEAVVRGETVRYRLGLPGRHWVLNSLAVLLGVVAAGADVKAALHVLRGLEPVKGRGSRLRLALAGGPALLIDESYNASPAAVEAALAVLETVAPPLPGGRRIAVLGDMLELGERAPALHAGLAGALETRGIDLVFTSGPQMRALYEALSPQRRVAHAADSAALAPVVAAAVRPGDVILVKGSAGSRMARVVEALRSRDGESGPEANSRA